MVVNAIVEDVESAKVVVKPVYADIVLDGIPVASVEEVLMLKTKLWRERVIIELPHNP